MTTDANRPHRFATRQMKGKPRPGTPLIRDAIVQAAIEAGNGDMVTGCTFSDTRAEIRL